MSTKKSKNKNRPKTVQVLQENDNTISEISKIEYVEKLESVKIDGGKVQECSINEENNLKDLIPKKPKRNKSKNKKDKFVEDNQHDELPEPQEHQELEKNVEISPQECIEEVPKDGKKKNKNKKRKTQPIVDEDDLIHISVEKGALKEDLIDLNPNMSTQSIPTIGDVVLQKKKKKKKNRLDSDKSDKAETFNSCTLAFQKLLQSSGKSDQEISDSETISKATIDVLKVDITPQLPDISLKKNEDQQCNEITKCEDSKTKGKNKKGKKEPQVESIKMEIKESLENITSQDNILSQHDYKTLEESQKPNSQIAKPVEKKRRIKKNIQESNHENVSPSLIKANESLEQADTTQLKIVHLEDNDVVPTNIGIKTDIFKEKIKGDEVICESSEFLQKNNDMNQSEPDIKVDYSDFVKVNTGKNKKKKNKDVENISLSKTIMTYPDTSSNNLDVITDQTKSCNIEGEEFDTSIIVPDFIDYPRSVSQTLVDNNNNTIIQEIKSPEELKLGISILTSVPTIQGSGESPEAQNSKADNSTKVTKIDLKNLNSAVEKTDIKSKMIEVNRDMEELRRSIERSLAELTNTEENDSSIEKDFEEIYQNQSQESKTVKFADRTIRSENESFNLQNEDKMGSEKTFSSNSSQSQNLTALNNPQTTLKDEDYLQTMCAQTTVPVCPIRKNKGKGKSKRKGKQDMSCTPTSSVSIAETAAISKNAESSQESKNEEKSSKNADSSHEKCENQKAELVDNNKCHTQDKKSNMNLRLTFEPIENFEDALTSSVDDVNKTFELIASELNDSANTFQYQNNPEIKIIAPVDEIEQDEKQKQEERWKKKETPVSQPKNLLGHTDIPAQSNKADYKKEKNKEPNYIQAKVKIKDSDDIEKKSKELAKESTKRKGDVSNNMSKFSAPSKNANQEFVYKYNFRKVFLQSLCHLCQSEIVYRTPCQFCSIVFYCSLKHKDEDWPQHQPLCFAVSTIAHLKDQKHIYADAKNITGQEYRILRMQMILSCEKILKRKLVPWEQEAILYPRICANVMCREWKQKKLTDCEGCGQISFCSDHPDHLPSTHQRWCKPYALYKKLVMYHQNFGKLEPRLPTKVLEHYQMTDNMNEVLGSMYEEKIDISDIQYATLTQIASAPLTTVYCYQLFDAKYHSTTNGITEKSTFTVHSIGSELHSEADSLYKWETFFLHLLSDVKELRVVFIDPDLNQSDLPLDLLGDIKLCESCRTNNRRVIFKFEDKKNYHEYYSSEEFIVPNIVCAFNSNIQRSSAYSSRDNWPSSINCILQQRIPFVVTSYTLEELKHDVGYIKRSRIGFEVISEAKHNSFASVRPDRNFVTDHDMPLLFKNYSFSIFCGA